MGVLRRHRQTVRRDPLMVAAIEDRRTVLAPRRDERVERVGAAGVARLDAVGHREGGLVRDVLLELQLAVLVQQLRVVRLVAVPQILDRVRVVAGRILRVREAGVGRQGLAGAAERRVVEVHDADVDHVLRRRAPVPELVLDDRPADLEAVVVDVLDRVAARRAEIALRGEDVVRLELLVRAVEPSGAAQRVAAALRDEVHLHAGALLRRVARCDVADDRAVHRPLLVVARAHRGERGLLAGEVAADVLAAHHHPRRLLQHDPRVACRRNRFERVLREARRNRRRARVHHRALAAHRDGFLHRRDVELRVDLRVEARLDDDAVADAPLESGELERDRIGADRNAREPVGAALDRDRRLRLDERRSAQRDGDAGQDRAGGIGDLSEHRTHADLRARRSGGGQQHEAHTCSCAAKGSAHRSS